MQKQTSRYFSFLFLNCLLFSIALHTFVIYIFYNKPFWISKLLSFQQNFKPQENVVYESEELILDEVLNQLIVVSPGKKPLDSSLPSKENSLTVFDHIHHPEFKELSFSPRFSLLEEENNYFLIKENVYASTLEPITFPILSPSVALVQNADAYLTLPIAPVPFAARETTAPPPLAISPSKESCPSLELSIHDSSPQILASYHFSENRGKDKNNTYASEFKEHDFSKILPTSVTSQNALSALENYKLPQWQEETNWNDLFTVDVQVMPRSQQEGVYFAITLKPKIDAVDKCLKQNFHFIIDASAKTEAHRISSYKRALTRAMQYLSEGQSFNIHILDKQIYTLAESPIEVSKKTIAQAKEFLEQGSKKKASAKGTLFSLLEQIRSQPNPEMDTVILLTDGGFLTERKGTESLRKWLLNSGSSPFVLHIATVGNKPHSALLDALAASSGGKVLHSQTHAAFPRKFSKLLIDLKTPIATDISALLDIKNTNLAISLMGTSCKLPLLFASQPMTLYGVANTSSSFILQLQGWNRASPIELSFEINLDKGRRGNLSMKHIALQDQAEHELSLFLTEGELKHLDQAIEFLETATESRKRI